ncbi:MAG: 1-deoxy-D-xylulose-5-phosphate reductoisomerase [Nitrospirota bacterium]|jgi:1-deoxy-D-xylulose-5-phosphate reductoisomerase
MKNIVVLGSTGSIGRSTLSVVAEHPGLFRVVGLAARRNHDLLLRQVRDFSPEVVAVFDGEAARTVKAGCRVPVLDGPEGLEEVARHPGADIVISAIEGSAGLAPTLAALGAGKTVGLANKETLVIAGAVVRRAAREHGARILPVDSEHSAVFQCLEGGGREHLRRIVLTASGGPFVHKSAGELREVTPEEALRHPSWSMGRKITVDSATLMNKGLEVIEAHHLFDLGPERIGVVVHPQSIVHSLVEFVDGSLLAQLSVPDMRGAIAYALSYPQRLDGVIERLDLAEVGTLSFHEPDTERFPCLAYAYEALRAGGTMPAVLNAANEVAVEAFLQGRLAFTDIPVVIRQSMGEHTAARADDLEAVLEAHRWAAGRALELVGTASSSQGRTRARR